MSQVIYARVPESVKSDVEEYAETRGLSLSSAATDLLQRGLAAAGEERSILMLESKLAAASAQKSEAEARLDAVASEVAALRSFVQRARSTTVGACPSCRASISGLDLLGRGQCGACSGSLMELFAPSSAPVKPALDDREVGALVGALGVVLLAAAVFGSKGA